MGCGEKRFARLLERSFLEPLSAGQWVELRAHLAICQGCRADYDRLGKLERALGGGQAPLSQEKLDLIGQAVLARVASGSPPARAEKRLWPRAAAILVPAAAVLTLVVALVPRERSLFQARSSGPVAAEGVRGFCIDAAADPPRIRASTDFGPGAALRCARSDSLQLSFTSGHAESHLAILSLPESGAGETFRYSGPEGAEGTVRIEPDRVDEPLPFSIRLEARHSPGARVIVAIFADRPLSPEQAEAAARAVVAGEKPAEVRIARVARLVIE